MKNMNLANYHELVKQMYFLMFYTKSILFFRYFVVLEFRYNESEFILCLYHHRY